MYLEVFSENNQEEEKEKKKKGEEKGENRIKNARSKEPERGYKINRKNKKKKIKK